jgi:glutaryl-CoA dehydrogenase
VASFNAACRGIAHLTAAFHLGRLVEQAKLRCTIAGLAKMNNTIKARDVIAEARSLLGGNGIRLE